MISMEQEQKGLANPNFPEEEVTDVQSSALHYILARPKYYLSALFLVFLGVGLGFYLHSPDVIILCFAGVFLIYGFVAAKMRKTLMQDFAKDIGYSFTDSADIGSVAGALFSVGHSQSISDVISGTDKDRPVRVFLYQYTVGSGKNSHTYFYSVCENTFSGTVPHILLHKPEFFLLGNVPTFSGGESITLEGDFNKYFSLYVEKGFEQEAYEIFTPDFMAELEDTAKKLNFEFFQNKLYIYMPKYIETRAELDAMFALADKLCDKLEPLLDRMKAH